MPVIFTFEAKEGQSLKANLVRQAEILLVDDQNYVLRKDGAEYKAIGAHFTTSPAVIHLPRPGRWHLIIEDHVHDEATASLLGP